MKRGIGAVLLALSLVGSAFAQGQQSQSQQQRQQGGGSQSQQQSQQQGGDKDDHDGSKWCRLGHLGSPEKRWELERQCRWPGLFDWAVKYRCLGNPETCDIASDIIDGRTPFIMMEPASMDGKGGLACKDDDGNSYDWNRVYERIAAGCMNRSIRKWAQQCSVYKSEINIALFPFANAPWSQWSVMADQPYKYGAKYRYMLDDYWAACEVVKRIFDEEGADNVRFIFAFSKPADWWWDMGCVEWWDLVPEWCDGLYFHQHCYPDDDGDCPSVYQQFEWLADDLREWGLPYYFGSAFPGKYYGKWNWFSQLPSDLSELGCDGFIYDDEDWGDWDWSINCDNEREMDGFKSFVEGLMN